MKNNFVPPFHKKQYEAINKNTTPYFLKNAHHHQYTAKTHIKRANFNNEAQSSQNNTYNSIKHHEVGKAEDLTNEQNNSCKSSETTIKPSKVEHKAGKEPRAVSPFKYSNTSPLKTLSSLSPKIKESQISSNHCLPVRSTLKNLLNPKHLTFENSLSEAYSRQIQGNTSIGANRALTDTRHSPSRNKDKQNQILREQNQLLRRQLQEIKKRLVNKKEELSHNLRETIKRQDNEIKQLRTQISIMTKKNNVLISMLENKDEEIAFITNKLEQSEQELRQFKQRNAQKFQKLKERINFMLKSYSDLQTKWTQAELEWLQFKAAWMEQKETYIQRITFLEQYIANY